MPVVMATAETLGSIQKTLLLPLWGRAVETRKPHPLLVDPAEARIIESIDYDFSTIAANISFVSQLAWITRSLHIDRTIRKFLEQHPIGTIVNLGCGLDTTFERVDNGMLTWFDLDLPDVIELRDHYIREEQRRSFIACSMLDDKWIDRVKIANKVLFVAAGVLYYFEETQVRLLLGKLADCFAGSELIFDACSPRGLRIANKRVIRDGGMDQGAELKWGIQNLADLQKWDSRIEILAEYPIFHEMKRGLTLKEKWGTFLSDTLRIMSMVHLHFRSNRTP